MPCCGDKRRQITATPRNGVERMAAAGMEQQIVPSQTVQFRYEGKTALTVMGPITRLRYRFASPRAVLDVDTRDAPSVAAVPHLRRVPG